MKKLLIFLLFFLFNNPVFAFYELNSNRLFFSNYENLIQCLGNQNNFLSYKINLKNCYASRGIFIPISSLDRLSNNPTKIFSKIPLNNKIASIQQNYRIELSDKTPIALEKFIKQYPQFIYGFHKEVIWLSKMSIISNDARNLLLTTAYNSFEPILLAQASSAATTSGASTGAGSAAGGSASAAGGASAGASAGGAAAGGATAGASAAGAAGAGAAGAAGAAAGAAAAAASVAVTTTAVAVGVAGAAVAVSSTSSSSESDGSGSSGVAVNLSISSNSISENGSSLTITATAAEELSKNITVSISTSGTAIEGTDYSNVSDITILSGALSGTTTFNVLDDASDPVYEEDETAILTIASVSSGGSIGATSSQTITITENESVPTISLSGTASIDEKTGTATITANSSIKTDSNMIVSLNKAGTATNSTDYSLSDITISSGSTAGTSTLSPVNDTDYESGSETVILTISSVTGISGTNNSSSSITVTITNDALNSGTQLTYNSSNATTRASHAEFTEFNDDDDSSRGGGSFSTASVQNPLEVINAHKAFGYGLSGDGVKVAVLDGRYSTHNDLNDSGKVEKYEVNGSLPATTSTSSHGNAVSGVIAADFGDGGLVGVAPSAKLIQGSNSNTSGGSSLQHKADFTNYVASQNAVAHNNSWGWCTGSPCSDYTIANGDTLIAAGKTNYEIVAKYGDGSYSATSTATNYINAMDDFQDKGVIVFALSNDSSLTNADFTAGMPEFFSQLKEAWITAANVNIVGASGSETYTLMSAPCGDTAPYCIAGDGYAVSVLAHNNGYTNPFHSCSGSSCSISTGTSYVAPQVSGAVALVAEAFPNQTPEQWADRLLASANNVIGFTQTGSVTFGNGVVHGYSSEAGHGIMDIYAALQPITADSSARGMKIYSGSSNTSGRSYNLYDSRIFSSRSFGDSIIKGLKGIDNYTFDALDGGFKYDVSGHVSQMANTASVIDLNKELNSLKLPLDNINDFSLNWKMDFSGAAMDEIIQTSSKNSHRYITTAASASAPIQNFYYVSKTFDNLYHDYQAPYLASSEGGIGFSFLRSYTKGRILFGISNPATTRSENELGKEKSVTLGYDHKLNEKLLISSILGIAKENDRFLNLKGEGAFTLENSKSTTSFAGFKLNLKASKNGQFITLINYANSNFEGSDYTLLQGANNVTSSSYFFGYNYKKLFSDDEILFYLSQPNRVERGNIDIRLTNLPDQNGNITYTKHSINLLPSGRQKDFGLSYNKLFENDYYINLKMIGTRENNHIKSSKDVLSGFIGLGFKNLSMGASNASNREGFDTKLLYNMNF